MTTPMKDQILSHLEDPGQLERLYRGNKGLFKREFSLIYPTLKGNLLADGWNERLAFEADDLYWGSGKELLGIGLAALLAGLIAKIPAIFFIDPEYFYPRNIGFIFLPLVTAYFAWKNKLNLRRVALLMGIMVVSVFYINWLPGTPDSSDTLILACIHLPLLLWVLLGSAFVGNHLQDHRRRLGFLRYNGDLAVIMALLLISGGIMTGLTLGLFSLIGFHIEKFYFENVVIMGLAAVPIVGTYLTQTNPQLVGKVSPVIARIFSPLVLVMLMVYLVAMAYSGKDPFNDREFLLMFNALLIGVMAIIFFSVAESYKARKSQAETWILFLLSVVTILVNGIALSAILFRISEWGITPNRLAVLGGNLLILVNLILVTVQLFKVFTKKAELDGVGKSIAYFLPIYFIWTLLVTFLFPVLFGFK
jgi:hypothetical protein